MNTKLWAKFLALSLWLGACGADQRNEPGSSPVPSRDGGAMPGSPGVGGASAPTTGSGGSGGRSGTGGTAAGSGGASSSGTGGSAGTGGSSGSNDAGSVPQDAAPGSGPDAAADAAPAPSCMIELRAISPQRVIKVPAGEGARFRMAAILSGSSAPAKPVWQWKVTLDGQAITHTPVDGEPSMIDFPTVKPGLYDVRAQLPAATPPCPIASRLVDVIVPSGRIDDYFIRVTPPSGQALPVIEHNFSVQARTAPSPKSLEFPTMDVFAVQAVNEGGSEIENYFVQVSSRASTSRFEGYVTKGPFRARLNSNIKYRVLIVPDPHGGGTARAPVVFPESFPNAFTFAPFQVSEGLAVTGTVSTEAGPLDKARVRLRDELLPSTVGTSDATGQYQLLARPGKFEARVIPPVASGLPEAQLPRSTGVEIPAFGLGDRLNFVYAPLTMVGLKLTVTTAEGAPAERTTVVLEAKEGELANVGAFSVPGQGTIAAEGVMRVSRDTQQGAVTFDRVPRARYRVILVPPPDLAGDHAITSIDLDLTAGAGPTLMRTAALGKRSRIVGTLKPPAGVNPSSLVVRAVDTAEDGIRRTVLLGVDGTGRFELPSDPGRVYWLFVEPPADRSLPRIALDSVRGGPGPVTVAHTLPERLPLTGEVKDRGKAVAGAIVQVFCWGDAPACVDRETPDLSNVLPVDETISAGDGSFKLSLSDLGQ